MNDPSSSERAPRALSEQLVFNARRGCRLVRGLLVHGRAAVHRRTALFVPKAPFTRVQRFCFFLAPARSGHSIVAHLLSAHPDVLICDEQHALQDLQDGRTAAQIYALIREQDTYAELCRRMKSGYDYAAPGTAQGAGRQKRPLVIGDAKGGQTMKLLASGPGLVDRLRAETGVPLRVVVQVRHPFDIIASKMRRRKLTLEQAARGVTKMTDRLEMAVNLMRDDEMLFQRHEDLLVAPEKQFDRLFRFLDVEPIPEIVTACAAKIAQAPDRTRRPLPWPDDTEERFVAAMKRSRFFASYFADAPASTEASGPPS